MNARLTGMTKSLEVMHGLIASSAGRG